MKFVNKFGDCGGFSSAQMNASIDLRAGRFFYVLMKIKYFGALGASGCDRQHSVKLCKKSEVFA